MKLERVLFQNFQGFLGDQIAQIAPITLIFGPNASGKSSISRALKLMKQSQGSLGVRNNVGHFFDGPDLDLGTGQTAIYGQLKDPRGPQYLGLGLGLGFQNLKAFIGIKSVSTFLSENVSAGKEEYFFCDTKITVSEEIAHDLSGNTVTIRMDSMEGLTLLEVDSDTILERLYQANRIRGEAYEKFDEAKTLVARMPLDGYGWEELLAESNPVISDHKITWGTFDGPDAVEWETFSNALINLPNAHRYRVTLIAEVVQTLNDWVASKIDSVEFIGPIRSIPPKIESVVWNTPSLSEGSLKANAWMKHLTGGRYEVGSSVLLDEVSLFTSRTNFVRDLYSNVTVGFSEVGTGISQVFPVISALFNSAGPLLAIEQPELHLHPRMQADLSDAFIEASSLFPDRALIIETHSESMLLRLQKRIREGVLPRESVSILFVDAGYPDVNGEKRFNQISTLSLDEMGDVIDPFPVNFADLRVQDLL